MHVSVVARAALALGAALVAAVPAFAQGIYSIPTASLSVLAVPTSATVPFEVSFLISVVHDGRLPKYVVQVDCDDGTPIYRSPETLGGVSPNFPNTSLYVANPCTYTVPGAYLPEIDLFEQKPSGLIHVAHFGSGTPNAPVITAISSVSSPGISSAAFSSASVVRPGSGLTLSAAVAGGTPPYAWAIDLDDSCGVNASSCGHSCYETPLPSGPSLAAAPLPDFPDLGTKFANLCVRDSAPSPVTDVERLTLDVLEQHIAVALTASPSSAVGASLDDVALEALITGEATGIGAPPGCALTFCGTENCSAGATEVPLYSNTFDTAGCSEATTASGAQTCPATPSVAGPQGGTVALVGQTAGGTNLLRFASKYVSALEQVFEFSMRITAEGTSNNQALFRPRYGGSASAIILRRADDANNTLSLERDGAACSTSAADAYTVGTWATYTMTLNTDTGAIALFKDGSQTPIASCTGTVGDYPADGFELIVTNGIAEFDHIDISTISGAGSAVLEVVGATANPFDTATDGPDAPFLFDGYATGTTRAKVSVCCGTAPCADAFAEISVQPDVTLTAAVTPSVTTPCIAGSCFLTDATIDFGGTATGAVTDVQLLMNGAVIFADATASDPYALVADGAAAGFEAVALNTPGTIPFLVRGTRGGKTAEQSFAVNVQEPVTTVPDLIANPASIQSSTTVSVNAAQRCVDIIDAAGGALPFACVESAAWLSLSGASGTTPVQACATFNNVGAALGVGTWTTDIVCTRTDAPTDTATIPVQLLIQDPGGATPWIDGFDGTGRPLLDTGTGLGVVTMHKNTKLANQSGLYTGNNTLSNLLTNNVLLWGTTLDRLGGRPANSLCYPASTCGGDDGDRDALHFPWGSGSTSYRSNITYMKWVTAKNAWFAREQCPGDCPHADAWQGYGGSGLCPANWWIVQDSEFLNSESGQQFHNTVWMDGDDEATPNACDLNAFVLQNVRVEQEPLFVEGCNARSAVLAQFATSTNNPDKTRACSKLHANLPVRAVSPGSYNPSTNPSPWTNWLIGGVGPVKGGNASNCVINRTVRIGFDSSRTAGLFVCDAALYKDYASIEAALAAGETRPPFLQKSCTGWASPPPNCTPTNQRGDQD